MWSIRAPNQEAYQAAWKLLTRVKHLTFIADEASRHIAVGEDLDPVVVEQLLATGCVATLDNSR
jgi:hypothetical protein